MIWSSRAAEEEQGVTNLDWMRAKAVNMDGRDALVFRQYIFSPS